MSNSTIPFRPALIGLVLAVASGAGARGSLLDAKSLPPAVAKEYADAVAASKARDSEPFDFIRQVASDTPKLDQHKRGRLAPLVRLFESMGESGLWALVEAVAFNGPEDAKWSATARTAWQAGVVEAIGRLRDPRMVPLLDALLAALPSDAIVAREVVVARGLFADDQGVRLLTRMAGTAGPHQDAVLAGLGRCRRVGAAEALAAALIGAIRTSDGPRIRAVIESLSDVGNAWVWDAIPPVLGVEGDVVRQLAARALVSAYVALEGHARQAASNAIMVVDFVGTPGLIDAERAAASPAGRDALHALHARFERNPTR